MHALIRSILEPKIDAGNNIAGKMTEANYSKDTCDTEVNYSKDTPPNLVPL
jgi:hypothetical protein